MVFTLFPGYFQVISKISLFPVFFHVFHLISTLCPPYFQVISRLVQTQNTKSHIVRVINTCEQRTLQKEIFTQWKLLRSNTGASWCPHVETLAWVAATPEAFSDNNLLIIWDFNEDLNDMVCLEPFFELDTIL